MDEVLFHAKEWLAWFTLPCLDATVRDGCEQLSLPRPLLCLPKWAAAKVHMLDPRAAAQTRDTSLCPSDSLKALSVAWSTHLSPGTPASKGEEFHVAADMLL